MNDRASAVLVYALRMVGESWLIILYRVNSYVNCLVCFLLPSKIAGAVPFNPLFIGSGSDPAGCTSPWFALLPPPLLSGPPGGSPGLPPRGFGWPGFPNGGPPPPASRPSLLSSFGRPPVPKLVNVRCISALPLGVFVPVVVCCIVVVAMAGRVDASNLKANTSSRLTPEMVTLQLKITTNSPPSSS